MTQLLDDTRWDWWLTAVGLGLRLLLFRPPYVLLQNDEFEHVGDGLLPLDGVASGFKFAPGFWLGSIGAKKDSGWVLAGDRTRLAKAARVSP